MKRTISADYLHFKEVQVDIKPYSEKNQKLEIIQRTLDNLKSKTSLCNADDHDNYSDLMVSFLIFSRIKMIFPSILPFATKLILSV